MTGVRLRTYGARCQSCPLRVREFVRPGFGGVLHDSAWRSCVQCARCGDGLRLGRRCSARPRGDHRRRFAYGLRVERVSGGARHAALNASDALVFSESCASPGNCAAGGFYTGADNYQHPYVVDEAAGTWGKAQELPGSATTARPSAPMSTRRVGGRFSRTVRPAASGPLLPHLRPQPSPAFRTSPPTPCPARRRGTASQAATSRTKATTSTRSR